MYSIVKEGGLDMLAKVVMIVIYGSAISNLVCFALWPQSAISNLQLNVTKTLDSFATVLTMVTGSFLLEGGAHSKNHLEKALENHQNSFTSLKKSLNEARTEWVRRGDAEQCTGSWMKSSGKRAYEDAVDSLNRLGQHLNGLRSGTKLQYDLTRAGVFRGRSGKNKKSELDLGGSFDDDEETAILKAAAAMFGDIVDDLGPPLKALSVGNLPLNKSCSMIHPSHRLHALLP